jgi:hypothetical protein
VLLLMVGVPMMPILITGGGNTFCARIARVV